jgi:hypothetical protein
MDPAYSPLQQQILQMTRNRLNTSADLSGYAAQGTQNLNKNYDLINQSQSNNLTARGLGTSPVAGAVDARRENARIGDISGFQNQIPLLQRQLQAQDLASAQGVLGLGRGSTTTGSEGGGAAGAATNLAQMLGYLYGQGAFQNTGVAGGRPFVPPIPGNPNVGPSTLPAGGFTGWG